MADEREWLGKEQGKLKVLALIRPAAQGRSAMYKARCVCGQNVIVTTRDLEAGVDSCGCEAFKDRAPDKEQVIPPNFHDSTVPKGILLAYTNISHLCPPWWRTSLPNVVKGMVNMLARERYTKAFMAKWWECPVEFVECVESFSASQIEAAKKELEEVRRIYLAVIDRCYDDGFHRIGKENINSLRMALSPRSFMGRLYRRNMGDY